MKVKLTNNLSIKIMSIILAIVVWFIVVNVDDPITTKTFNGVTVGVENGPYIESMHKSYQIDDAQVSVTVRGNRSVLDRLTVESISATADMTQIVDMESTPIMVPVNVECPGVQEANITANPSNIAVQLEDMTSEDFVITSNMQDTKPAKGYEVGDVSISQEKINIMGPQSIINKIGKVVANIDVEGMKQDGDVPAELFVIDKNEDKLTDAQMATLRYDVGDGLTAHVTLWKVQTGIQIQAQSSGTPAEGYQVGEVTLTPSEISICGTQEALEKLAAAENMITIPPDMVNIDGQSKDVETKVNISSLLPEGTKLATDVSPTVLVKTTILPLGSREIEFATSKITPQNLTGGLLAVYDKDKIVLRVKASDDILNALKADNITAFADFAGKAEGKYEIPLSIVLPEGCELVDNVTVTVNISKKTATTNS